MGQYSNMREIFLTHSTINNNDGKQETSTGPDAMHDTSSTQFQLRISSELSSYEKAAPYVFGKCFRHPAFDKFPD